MNLKRRIFKTFIKGRGGILADSVENHAKALEGRDFTSPVSPLPPLCLAQAWNTVAAQRIFSE